MVLLFLKADFRQIFSPVEIDALVACGVVFRDFFAFQNIHRGVGHPGKVLSQIGGMLLSAAAAAYEGGIHEVIVGNIGFPAAVAAAMPEDVALGIPLVCGEQGCEPAEPVVLYILRIAQSDRRLSFRIRGSRGRG